ncbi:hypothetical protein [Natrinema saccharevitans]|nr:hypothetical protein [Natrinema saccharevitans]
MYDAVDWWVFSCTKQASTEYVDTEQTAKETKVDLHVQGQGIWEDWVSLETDINNYLEDSESIASLEAKHAIAEAYENNKSATVADTAAQEAIQDYYSTRQAKMLEDWSRQQAQLSYIGNVSENDSEISNTYVGRVMHEVSSGGGIGQTPRPAGGTGTVEATLINGSAYEYESANIEFAISSSTGGDNFWFGYNPKIDQLNDEGDIVIGENTENVYNVDRGKSGRTSFSGASLSSQTWINRAYNDAPPSLHSQMVFDEERWHTQWVALQEQAATMQENYPSGFASDVYAKHDSGELTTDELRSVEGMARSLRGL